MRRNKSIIVTIAILVLSNCRVLPADTNSTELGFSAGLGLGYAQHKERLSNNLLSEGTGTLLALRYNFGSDILHSIGLDAEVDFLHDKYCLHSHSIYYRLEYNLMGTLFDDNFRVGGFAALSNMLYFNNYYNAQHNFWSSYIALGLSVAKYFPINSEVSISVPLSLPIVALKSRSDIASKYLLDEPDYGLMEALEKMNSNYKFAVVGSGFFGIRTGADLTAPAFGRRFTVGYHFSYEQDKLGSTPEYQHISHSILLRFIF